MSGRLKLVFGVFIVLFLSIIARLFYWQIVKAEELSVLGQAQYGSLITLQPKRGEIKTSDGFPVASNKVSYLVFANPKEVKEKDKTAMLLSSQLGEDIASVSSVLSLDKVWVRVKANVTPETKETLSKLQLTGIGFEEESTRFYPEASLAAHLIGFVGKGEYGENKGYFGLEGYYDRQLAGKPGKAVQIHDAFGRPILSRVNENAGAIDGRSITLSLDRTVQFIAEKALAEGVERYGASGGMVGIIDPATGQILAMASMPSFDQGKYQEYSETLYKNPFISSLYEPGSTFKSLVMSSGFDSDAVEPYTKCPICAGPVSLGGYEIRTWNNTYTKNVTMIDVIKNSDNIGMVYVSQKLGLSEMLQYFEKFGIGHLTGIDLQGEVSAEIKPEDNWYEIDVATASFGQGVSVTPMQLLSGFAAIANEGIRMEPHVVSKIETADGKTIDIPAKEVSRPISSTTAKVMTEVLVNAASHGEANFARLKGYRIAGKTGTAQIPIAGHYDPNKTIASFIGFAPANKPKFAMLVIVDRPTTSIYGSETAAPIFFRIAKDLLMYYGIPPEE